MDRYLHANHDVWEQKALAHVESKFYDVAGFRRGKCTLRSIEQSLLGDVRGKRMLHLMCHFGLDSLSLARLGAEVVGLDFSENAIAIARRLSRETGLSASFVSANVYDLNRVIRNKRFDVVFMSYGCLGWLPDMGRLMRLVARALKRAGTFVLTEFHPVLWMLGDGVERIEYPYDSGGKPIVMTPQGTYANPGAKIRGKEYWYNHGLGTIVAAILDAPMQIRTLVEYPYAPYALPRYDMVRCGKGRWELRGAKGRIPTVFSVVARKPA